MTADFAAKGQGRQSDADRAATEREQRQSDLIETVNDIEIASARLCQLLNLDPSVRLAPDESRVVPNSLVPEPIPLPELLVIALTQRPEFKERQAAIRQALLQLKETQVLPFAPQLAFGYSVGEFGGGSNLVNTRFGDFGNREDLDAIMYWSLRNLGVGNWGLIHGARPAPPETAQRDHRPGPCPCQVAARHTSLAPWSARRKSILRESAAEQPERVQGRFHPHAQQTKACPSKCWTACGCSRRPRFAYLDAIINYNRAHLSCLWPWDNRRPT